MHNKIASALALACFVAVLGWQTPTPAFAQQRRQTAGQSQKVRVKRQPSAPAAPQQAAQATQERKDALLSSTSALDKIGSTISSITLDPLQLSIGAVLALVVRSMLVRLWHGFLGFLRFLFARRRRAITQAAQPVPQVQYVVAPPPPPQASAPVVAMPVAMAPAAA